MGLRKRIIHIDPNIKMTKELREQCDKVRETLAEGRAVNIMDPSDTSVRDISDILREDPAYFLQPGRGYDIDDGSSYEEFVKRTIVDK